MDKKGLFLLSQLKTAGNAKERGEPPTIEEALDEEIQQAWDDVSGRELDAKTVRREIGGR